jgi:hypothetical protein
MRDYKAEHDAWKTTSKQDMLDIQLKAQQDHDHFCANFTTLNEALVNAQHSTVQAFQRTSAQMSTIVTTIKDLKGTVDTRELLKEDTGMLRGRQVDALHLKHGDAFTIRLFQTSSHLCYMHDALQFIDMDPHDASTNPDCLFVLHDWNEGHCRLALASEGHYITMERKPQVLARGFVTTLSPSASPTTEITMEPLVQGDYACVRMLSNTGHYLAALPVNGTLLLASRSIVRDSKGVFCLTPVDEI